MSVCVTWTARVSRQLRVSRLPDGRVHFVCVRATLQPDGAIRVEKSGERKSHVLRTLADATALAILPDGPGCVAERAWRFCYSTSIASRQCRIAGLLSPRPNPAAEHGCNDCARRSDSGSEAAQPDLNTPEVRWTQPRSVRVFARLGRTPTDPMEWKPIRSGGHYET